jgi:hypothetical protein
MFLSEKFKEQNELAKVKYLGSDTERIWTQVYLVFMSLPFKISSNCSFIYVSTINVHFNIWQEILVVDKVIGLNALAIVGY